MYKLQMNLDGIRREDSIDMKVIDKEAEKLIALTHSINYSQK